MAFSALSATRWAKKLRSVGGRGSALSLREPSSSCPESEEMSWGAGENSVNQSNEGGFSEAVGADNER